MNENMRHAYVVDISDWRVFFLASSVKKIDETCLTVIFRTSITFVHWLQTWSWHIVRSMFFALFLLDLHICSVNSIRFFKNLESRLSSMTFHWLGWIKAWMRVLLLPGISTISSDGFMHDVFNTKVLQNSIITWLFNFSKKKGLQCWWDCWHCSTGTLETQLWSRLMRVWVSTIDSNCGTNSVNLNNLKRNLNIFMLNKKFCSFHFCAHVAYAHCQWIKKRKMSEEKQ